MIISDYAQGLLSPQILAAIIGAGRRAGVPVVIDPSGTDYAIYAGADIVKPNRDELIAASGLPVNDDETAIAAARRLIDEFGFRAVLATRGAQGATLVDSAQTRPVHLKARARDVFDVSGAGDTVMALLGAGIAAGLSLEAAAGLANIAAGLVVAKFGTAVVTPDELKAELRAEERSQAGSGDNLNPGAAGRILSLENLLERLEEWRCRGWRIGFTNGCFDLLHPGHVALFGAGAGGL